MCGNQAILLFLLLFLFFKNSEHPLVEVGGSGAESPQGVPGQRRGYGLRCKAPENFGKCLQAARFLRGLRGGLLVPPHPAGGGTTQPPPPPGILPIILFYGLTRMGYAACNEAREYVLAPVSNHILRRTGIDVFGHLLHSDPPDLGKWEPGEVALSMSLPAKGASQMGMVARHLERISSECHFWCVQPNKSPPFPGCIFPSTSGHP